VVKSLRKRTDLYFDCHLMIDNPGDFLDDFADAGANGCTIHVELSDVVPLFGEMRRLGLDVGLAVNPETPFEECLPHLAHIDLLLLMTVHPGFGGQAFIGEVMDKVKQARAEIDARGLKIALEVDGGINEQTAPIAAAAGADVFVAGSAIFGAEDPLAAARRIRDAVA
jgi:ribulose-phosphate 3-epimerase